MNDETIKLIQSKVTLFKNQKYFKLFKDIFIKCTMKLMKNDNYINNKNINNNKIDNISINKIENSAYWTKIMKNIYMPKKIKGYILKKNILTDEEYNLDSNKDRIDYFYVFFKNNKTYETNNLVYLYLSYLSKIQLQKLNIISKKEKAPLTNIARIYLGLCAQKIGIMAVNRKKQIKNITNENLPMIKKSTNECHLDEDTTKEENSPKNKINKEKNKKINDYIVKIKYISDLKKKLAKKFMIKRNKDKDIKNINKNKNDKDISNISKNKIEEEIKNKDNFSDELMSEEFLQNLKNVKTKNKNGSLKVLYSSSFTRLFIGETDLDSIRERYLSNINVKKEEKIEGKKKNLNPSDYLKKFANRLIQIQDNQLPIIERNMETVLSKFKKNQETIEKFKKLCAEEGIFNGKEREKIKDDYNFKKDLNTEYKNNPNKNKLDLDMDLNDINKNINYKTLSAQKNNKTEIMKTPEKERKIEKIDLIKLNQDINIPKNNKKNLSFNRKANKNVFRLNKNNTINEYKKKSNNKIFKPKLKNNFFLKINNNNNAFLTERNNSNKRSRFKTIFEKKLFRNKDTNLNNNIFYNKNLTSRGDKNLYDKYDNSKYQRTKNFFTKNDFYF